MQPNMSGKFLIISMLSVLISLGLGKEPICPGSDVLLFERIVRLENDIRTNSETLGNVMDKLSGSSVLSGNGPVPYIQPPLAVAELEKNGWTLVFLAHSGNGASAYGAWASGTLTNDQKPVTMARTLSSHYRDPGIDNWNSHNIKYVKFALYEELREVAYVIFNAAGSDNVNWFQASRVVSSSWSDLTPKGTFNVFSMTIHPRRRFYISKSHGGCSIDRGYIAVIDVNQKGCPWDSHPAYPQFLYSKINTADIWERRQYGRADHLAIFVYF